MNKFFSSKKFKYGTAATVITAAIIVLFIVLNAAVTALGTINRWYTDLTTDNYYKLSDAFKSKYTEINGGEDGVNFNIVIMMDEDKFATYDYQTVILYNTIKEITKTYDNVRLKAINERTYPAEVEKYKEIYGDNINLTDVIVEAADENFEPIESIGTKKYGINFFFIVGSDGTLYGYNAEAGFLSAFSQMLGKNENPPVAFYLTGHGEPALATQTDSWAEVLERAGFVVREMNLMTNDFSEYYDVDAAGDYNNCVVVINNPRRDLFVPALGEEGVSEVKKLRDFFGSGYGNIIVAVDSTTPELPALSQLLSEYGLGYGGAIHDSRHSIASSEAAKITADYSRMESGLSKLLVNGLRGTSNKSLPETVFDHPTNVYVKDSTTGSADSMHGYNGKYSMDALLYPYRSAEINDRDGYEECFIGSFNSQWDTNDDENTQSYAFVIGTTDFLSSSYANSFLNRSIMSWMLGQIYDEVVSFDGINFIRFTNNSALEVTSTEATAWTIATIVVIPTVAVAAGVVVWIRRRHS